MEKLNLKEANEFLKELKKVIENPIIESTRLTITLKIKKPKK